MPGNTDSHVTPLTVGNLKIISTYGIYTSDNVKMKWERWMKFNRTL